MDRIDDLLIKARAEMIGKAPKRNVVTKDVAFNMAWDIVKGYEDQMRALQEKRNNPGFFGRMKDAAKRGYQSARASRTQQNQVPLPTRSNEMRATTRNTGDPEFVDFMGQQGGLEQPQATRASGSPPTINEFTDFMGQQGGLEAPQALEPEEVPMRDEDINTEQPVETESARGAPPSFPGESPSVRAKVSGRPSDQRLFDAFRTLNPKNEEQRDIMMRVGSPEKRTVGATREDATRPLDVADIPMVSEQEELDARTQGKLGERRDTVRDDEYNRIMEQRNKISDRRVQRINSGDMTSGEAIRELKRIRQAGKYPDLPTMEETSAPSATEANRTLGGDETLRPNTRSPAVETPIQETTQGGVPRRRTGMRTNFPGQSTDLVPITQKKTPATEPLEPEEVMAMQRKPRGGVPAVRGKAPATTPLPPDELPMRGQPKLLPAPRQALGEERQLPSEAIGGQPQREGKQGGINAILESRQPVNEKNLSNRQRAGQRKSRNKDFIEEQIEPVKQPEPPQVEEQSEPVKKPEPQVEEQSEPVKPPQPPQVEEQATKQPPTARQTTLFGGEEQTAPAKPKDNATVEAAQERKAKRNANKQPQVKEKTEALKPIRSMSSEEVGELILDAQEGKAEAISHLKNYSDEVERVHPQFMDEMTDLFGETFKSNDDLSLLPSGMRQQLLKENNADVNYSLLPNGWV